MDQDNAIEAEGTPEPQPVAQPQPSPRPRTKTPEQRSAAARRQPQRSFIAEWTVTIILLLFGTTTLVQAFVIPTGSMEDTLLVGDHLLVDKLAYAPPGAASAATCCPIPNRSAATSSCSAIPWTSARRS